MRSYARRAYTGEFRLSGWGEHNLRVQQERDAWARLAENLERKHAKKTGRPRRKPAMAEKDLQEWVRKAATITGWRYYHAWISIRSKKGFPDTVLVHRGKRRLIFAELKNETNDLSEEQRDWIEDLQAIAEVCPLNVEVYVWRPADCDRIWEILQR